jgi:hypothetical protein
MTRNPSTGPHRRGRHHAGRGAPLRAAPRRHESAGSPRRPPRTDGLGRFCEVAERCQPAGNRSEQRSSVTHPGPPASLQRRPLEVPAGRGRPTAGSARTGAGCRLAPRLTGCAATRTSGPPELARNTRWPPLTVAAPSMTLPAATDRQGGLLTGSAIDSPVDLPSETTHAAHTPSRETSESCLTCPRCGLTITARVPHSRSGIARAAWRAVGGSSSSRDPGIPHR